MAVYHGHLEIAKLLIENGAKVNQIRTDNGIVPLYVAAEKGHLEIAELLIKKGAKVNQARTDDGVAPLHLAVYQGHLEIAKLLIENGADVNQARTDNGIAPLHVAVYQGHLEIAKLLIENGAKVNQANTDNGETPLSIAEQYKKKDVYKLICIRSQSLINHEVSSIIEIKSQFNDLNASYLEPLRRMARIMSQEFKSMFYAFMVYNKLSLAVELSSDICLKILFPKVIELTLADEYRKMPKLNPTLSNDLILRENYSISKKGEIEFNSHGEFKALPVLNANPPTS